MREGERDREKEGERRKINVETRYNTTSHEPVREKTHDNRRIEIIYVL